MELYLDWISRGRSFGDIRRDLEQKGYEDEEIREIIYQIDEYITAGDLRRSKKSSRRHIQWVYSYA